ncbi:MAG TPA: hypothetical protein VGY97_05630 [Solirubrobacteraceae bacterium]|jgi:hypothetical protein|nr:hypothetical protein [Solirubrobacteraceae bacterium]
MTDARVKASLWSRLGWRVRSAGTRAVLGVLGRPIRCAACGRPMFRAVPLIWRGRVLLLGAAEHQVRVSFQTRNSLQFRHVWLDQCPAPERPWVR